MEEENINKKLSEYNSILKENDEIYHKAAKKSGFLIVLF